MPAEESEVPGGPEVAAVNGEGGAKGPTALDVARLLGGNRKKGLPVDAEHKFWDTQPVPKLSEVRNDVVEAGPIDEIKTVDQVKPEGISLLSQFEWVTCDVGNDTELEEIYTLLNENYVEDDDCMFRFDYSKNFLRWALTSPGFIKDWHVGVRVRSNQKLVGFITGIPVAIKVHEQQLELAEINFLCVHKKLRDKRLAPVLIKEITRRVNLTDRWQAVYTAGVTLPRPITQTRYYHRALDIKKLVEVEFSHLPHRLTLSRAIRLYKLPDHPSTSGWRAMEKRDLSVVRQLLEVHWRKHKLCPIMTVEEVEHWLLTREGVVYSFVREEEGKVTDLFSFYSLPSSVINHEKHQTLHAAYSYYNVANTVDLKTLFSDCLIFAKDLGFDVFNALNISDNESVMTDLKFGIGDGFLRYYLYNWRCAEMHNKDVSLLLL